MLFKKVAVCTSVVAAAVGAAATTAPPAGATDAQRTGRQTAGVRQLTPCAARTVSAMTLTEQVGQLFISGIDANAPTTAELDTIRAHHLGGVILTGGSSAGTAATKRVADRAQAAADSAGVPLWVSADQEGGKVQHLKGSGFETMPTALDQGKLGAGTLQTRAKGWGRQLRAAGVNLNLAPVLDTVPAELGTGNRPIGYYSREYGYDPGTVTEHGLAFHSGMRDAGVQTSVKHFPGLGRVLGNTDTSKDVVDSSTTRTDAYLRPFKAAVDDGAQVVMVSTARYTKIDANNMAAFSSTVMNTVLRGDLGFKGVVVSDDLGAAVAVQDIPPGERAVRFLDAGGTVALTVDPSTLPAMVDAVMTKAGADSAFRGRVEAAASQVVAAKADAGLLRCS